MCIIITPTFGKFRFTYLLRLIFPTPIDFLLLGVKPSSGDPIFLIGREPIPLLDSKFRLHICWDSKTRSFRPPDKLLAQVDLRSHASFTDSFGM